MLEVQKLVREVYGIKYTCRYFKKYRILDISYLYMDRESALSMPTFGHILAVGKELLISTENG